MLNTLKRYATALVVAIIGVSATIDQFGVANIVGPVATLLEISEERARAIIMFVSVVAALLARSPLATPAPAPKVE